MRVKVLGTQGESSLIEWIENGIPQRGFVYAKEVENGECSDDALAEATPYGLPWAELINLKGITGAEIEKRLHLKGIWTFDDLKLKDRALIRIATDMLGAVIFEAGKKA